MTRGPMLWDGPNSHLRLMCLVLRKYGPLTVNGIVNRLKREGYRNIPTINTMNNLLARNGFTQVSKAYKPVGNSWYPVIVWFLPRPRVTVIHESETESIQRK